MYHALFTGYAAGLALAFVRVIYRYPPKQLVGLYYFLKIRRIREQVQ